MFKAALDKCFSVGPKLSVYDQYWFVIHCTADTSKVVHYYKIKSIEQDKKVKEDTNCWSAQSRPKLKV